MRRRSDNLLRALKAMLRHNYAVVYELRCAHAAVAESQRLNIRRNAVLFQDLRRQMRLDFVGISGKRNRGIVVHINRHFSCVFAPLR